MWIAFIWIMMNLWFFFLDWHKQFLPFRNYATVSTRSEYEKVQNKARIIELLTFHAISASGHLAISQWIIVFKFACLPGGCLVWFRLNFETALLQCINSFLNRIEYQLQAITYSLQLRHEGHNFHSVNSRMFHSYKNVIIADERMQYLGLWSAL